MSVCSQCRWWIELPDKEEKIKTFKTGHYENFKGPRGDCRLNPPSAMTLRTQLQAVRRQERHHVKERELKRTIAILDRYIKHYENEKRGSNDYARLALLNQLKMEVMS